MVVAVLGSMATVGVVSYNTNKLPGYENAVSVGSSSKSNLFVQKRLDLKNLCTPNFSMIYLIFEYYLGK